MGLLELDVIVLVEILVLLDVGLLDFFLALLMSEDELLVLHIELLLLQFLDAVLGKLGLDVAALFFASDTVLLHSGATRGQDSGLGSKTSRI